LDVEAPLVKANISGVGICNAWHMGPYWHGAQAGLIELRENYMLSETGDAPELEVDEVANLSREKGEEKSRELGIGCAGQRRDGAWLALTCHFDKEVHLM
jgi:hypothetical protein